MPWATIRARTYPSLTLILQTVCTPTPRLRSGGPRRGAAPTTTTQQCRASRHIQRALFVSARGHMQRVTAALPVWRHDRRSQDVRIRLRVEMPSDFLIVLEGGSRDVYTSAVMTGHNLKLVAGDRETYPSAALLRPTNASSMEHLESAVVAWQDSYASIQLRLGTEPSRSVQTHQSHLAALRVYGSHHMDRRRWYERETQLRFIVRVLVYSPAERTARHCRVYHNP